MEHFKRRLVSRFVLDHVKTVKVVLVKQDPDDAGMLFAIDERRWIGKSKAARVNGAEQTNRIAPNDSELRTGRVIVVANRVNSGHVLSFAKAAPLLLRSDGLEPELAFLGHKDVILNNGRLRFELPRRRFVPTFVSSALKRLISTWSWMKREVSI